MVSSKVFVLVDSIHIVVLFKSDFVNIHNIVFMIANLFNIGGKPIDL
jgi:hypothetical protein